MKNSRFCLVAHHSVRGSKLHQDWNSLLSCSVVQTSLFTSRLALPKKKFFFLYKAHAAGATRPPSISNPPTSQLVVLGGSIIKRNPSIEKKFYRNRIRVESELFINSDNGANVSWTRLTPNTSLIQFVLLCTLPTSHGGIITQERQRGPRSTRPATIQLAVEITESQQTASNRIRNAARIAIGRTDFGRKASFAIASIFEPHGARRRLHTPSSFGVDSVIRATRHQNLQRGTQTRNSGRRSRRESRRRRWFSRG